MAVIRFYKAKQLPSTPTANDDGIYFIKPDANTEYTAYVIDAGAVIPLDAITNSEFDSELLLKADDNAVVHKTGNETIAGVKTFTGQPTVPDGTSSNKAVNKGQLDSVNQSLQNAIDALETMINEGMRPPTDIDCSTNPNYPASEKGDTYMVTAAGRIGGASGIEVTEGDLIVCKADSAGGTQASVGGDFFIVQSNIHDATTTVKGYVMLATNAEAISGSNSTKAVTPAALKAAMDAFETAFESDILSTANNRFVRYDTSQGLSGGEQTQARGNIGAAADNAVVKLTGSQTVAGAKTFTTVPKSSQDAVGNNDLVRKSQMETLVTDSISWTTDTWD